MCDRCIAEYMLDLADDEEFDWAMIPWEPLTTEMRRVWDLVEQLYALPSCLTGGPLHIVVDDYNLEDDSLDFCDRELRGDEDAGDVTPEVAETSWRILRLMRGLSVRQRATALAQEWM